MYDLASRIRGSKCGCRAKGDTVNPWEAESRWCGWKPSREEKTKVGVERRARLPTRRDGGREEDDDGILGTEEKRGEGARVEGERGGCGQAETSKGMKRERETGGALLMCECAVESLACVTVLPWPKSDAVC